MDIFQDSVFLSRLQFSVTAMFHILWPLKSVGMSLVLVVFEALMGMTISYYPYMIPSSITIMEAASSSKTLIFMLTGIGFLVPVMLVYNGYQYFVFSEKNKNEDVDAS